MKLGNMIRDKKRETDEMRKKVQSVKSQRTHEVMSMPLKTKVYGGLMDSDISDLASTKAFSTYDRKHDPSWPHSGARSFAESTKKTVFS
jgi:hypothetical protein